jgi:Ca-activated chloride channel family protein
LWPQVVAAGLLMLMPDAVSVSAQQGECQAGGNATADAPEQQPNLTVDRDPVASPDPDPLRRLRRILRQRGRGRLSIVC